MILTNKQQEGLKIAVERYFADEKYTVISGYAGSGKTTLVRFIIEALDAEIQMAVDLGFDGKMAIHPKQVGRINELFQYFDFENMKEVKF